MKEYYSENGGRHLYNSDFKNLQELALSVSKMFGDCENGFVLCGCAVKNGYVEEGYVYIDGKVRIVETTEVSSTIDLCIVKNNTSGGSIQYYNGDTHKQYDNYGATVNLGKPNLPATDYIVYDSSLGRFPNIADVFFNKHALVKDSGDQTVYGKTTFVQKTIMSKLRLVSTDEQFSSEIFVDDAGNLNVVIYSQNLVEYVTYKFGNDGVINIYKGGNFQWKLDGSTNNGSGSGTTPTPSTPSTPTINTDGNVLRVVDVGANAVLSSLHDLFIARSSNLTLTLPLKVADGKTIRILWSGGSHTVRVNTDLSTNRIALVGTDFRSVYTSHVSQARVTDLVFHNGYWYLTDLM